jgi:hypothetical protein
LGVAHTHRFAGERLGDGRGREQQLDPLPVALVLVVPVVVVPVEPVLQGQLVGTVVLFDDVGVDHGRPIPDVLAVVLFVDAAGLEGIAGEIEEESLAEAEEVGCVRLRFDHRIAGAELAEQDLTVAEQAIDRHGTVRFAVCVTCRLLGLEHHDRCVLLGQLSGAVGVAAGQVVGAGRRGGESEGPDGQ